MFSGCTGGVSYKARALTCQQSVTEVVVFPSVVPVVAMATLRGKSEKLNCQHGWRRQREAATLTALLQQTQLVAVLCWTPFINMLIVSGQRSWLKGTSNPAGEEPCASGWRRIIISSWGISALVETLTNSCCMQRRHKKMSPWVCMLSITQLSVWNYSTLQPDKECFICTRCQTQLNTEKNQPPRSTRAQQNCLLHMTHTPNTI